MNKNLKKEKGKWVYTFVTIVYILLLIAIIYLINLNGNDIKIEDIVIFNLFFNKDWLFKTIIIIWLIIITIKIKKLAKK